MRDSIIRRTVVTMDRRQLITVQPPSLMTTQSQAATPDSPRAFLELKTYRLHNSEESQSKRVSDYLEAGLFPALTPCRQSP